MNKIDLLLEKFLTGFNVYGHTVEVFVNPSKKERNEISDRSGNFRFIADAKNKKVYIFPADHFHRRMWNDVLKKELHDSRQIYSTPDLFAGAMESNKVKNWGFSDNLYNLGALEEWLTHPDMFDFTKKYDIDVSRWIDDYIEDIQYKVDNYR